MMILSLKNSSESPLVLHDIFTFFAQLVFVSTEEPMILNSLAKLPFPTFEIFMEIFNIVCLELTPKMNPKHPDNLYSILSVFAIREIASSEVTAVYPFLTYAMVHKSCGLLRYLKTPPETYVADLEANYLLMPLNSLKQQIFDMSIQNLIKIMTFRLKEFIKPESSENKLYMKANFFGELFMLDFIKTQYTCTSNKLNTYNYSKIDNRSILRYKELQLQLQQILQMGETDYYSEMYVRVQNNAKIKSIKKQLNHIEKHKTLHDVVDREESILELVELSRNSFDRIILTKTARLALLTQIQSYTKTSENASSIAIHRSMWISYQLSRLADYSTFYLEILQKRFKKIFIGNSKTSAVNSCYETAVGYADIDVYLKHGHMEEAFNTVISIFEIDFPALDINLKVFLIYKAVAAWLISNKDTFHASRRCLSAIYCNKEVENHYCIYNVIKKEFKPNDLMPWIMLACKELGLFEFPQRVKEEIAYILFEILFLLLKYCEDDLYLAEQANNAENKIYLGLAADILDKTLNFNMFMDITSNSDLSSFQREYELEDAIEYRVISRTSEKEISKALDSEWYNEVRTISVHHTSSRCLRKIRKSYKKKPKAISAFDGMVNFYSPSITLIRVLYAYYSELLDLFFKVPLPKVLDFHHVLSRFSYVGDLVLKLEKWRPSPEEELKLKEDIIEEFQGFSNWKKIITPTMEDPDKQYQKKYKMKWPHRLRLARKHRR